jgi:uncharacterized membrane protein YqjE
MSTDGDGQVAQQLKGLGDATSRLVREHVELAKIELREGAVKAARDLAATVAGGLLLALGWLFLAFAIGYGLAVPLGLSRAFVLVAAAHVVVGGLLVAVATRRLRTKDRPALPETTRALARDRVVFREVRHIIRGEPRTR